MIESPVPPHTGSPATFDPDEVRALTAAGSPVRLPAQWAFIHEHTPSDAAYLILDGTAAVFRGRRPVATLGPGDLVGEGGFVFGTLRNATVASRARVAAVRIDYADLAALCDAHPGLGRRIAELGQRRAA